MPTALKNLNYKRILFAVAAIFLPAMIAFLGYLYFQELRNSDGLSDKYIELSDEYNKLNSDYLDLSTSSASSSATLNKQVKTLQKENAALEKENKASEKDYKNSETKVKAYTALLAYFSSVVRNHKGFSGWANAEYLHAKGLAQATGDSGIVSKTDWAWNRTDIDQITRVTGWLDEVVAGTNNSFK